MIVYVILIADRGYVLGPGKGYYGYSAAKRISEETGGRLIDVGNNGNKLQAAFQQIQDELRTQYVASYTPSNTTADGTFRHIARRVQRRQRRQPEGAGAQRVLRAVAGELARFQGCCTTKPFQPSRRDPPVPPGQRNNLLPVTGNERTLRARKKM